jgi:3D (Asp-Asp-Asp) domain-containing protein
MNVTQKIEAKRRELNRNKRGKFKKKGFEWKRLGREIMFYIGMVAILNNVVEFAKTYSGVRTIVIENVQAKMEDEDMVEAFKIDPCSMKDVVCDSEVVKGGKEVLATTYNAEEAQTDADPFTMASGARVYEGAVASNCYPLKSKIVIEGMGEFTVEDRMNKRYTVDCGTEKERIDIFKWERKDNFAKKVTIKKI